MDMKIIEERLLRYQPESKQEELNAFKEISQEIALRALSRASFFKQAAFQGGTSLCIIYGLQRFSEDLDFILYKPTPEFKWQAYLDEIALEFAAYGFTLEIKDRSEVSGAIKQAFIKENSFGKVLKLIYTSDRVDPQSALIKLEVDTNPPMGSQYENKIIDFPTPFSLSVQTIPSLFSGKIHALLCRSYVKGRDWYDFIWYVSRGAQIEFEFLQNALHQQGPWMNESLEINYQWVREALINKIEQIDWQQAKQDILPFIKPREHDSIQLWNREFFIHFVNKLQDLG